MNRWRIAIAAMLASGLAATAAGQPSEGGGNDRDAPESSRASQSTKPSWEDYRIVIERNIFSRDRSPRPARRENPTPEPEPHDEGPPPEPPPEQAYYVLVGVSIIGDRPTAFFEDKRNGEVHSLREGEALADRRVTSITLDRLTAAATDEPEAEPIVIAVGRALTGGDPAGGASVAGPRGSAGPAPSDSATSTSTGGDGGSSDNASLLERLRQRRQQELEQ